MKKECVVLGIGQRKAGIGKTSKQPYDFTEVAIAFADSRFDGQRAEVVSIDQEILAQHPIAVGEVFDAEIYQMNFKTRLACIYG